jgi:hypothetical protein
VGGAYPPPGWCGTGGSVEGRFAGEGVESGTGAEGDGAVTDGPWNSFAISLLLILGAGEGVDVGAVVGAVEDEAIEGAADVVEVVVVEEVEGGRLVKTDLFVAEPPF